jgi:hypothetical protein
MAENFPGFCVLLQEQRRKERVEKKRNKDLKKKKTDSKSRKRKRKSETESENGRKLSRILCFIFFVSTQRSANWTQ